MRGAWPDPGSALLLGRGRVSRVDRWFRRVSLGCGEIVKVARPKLPRFAGWLEGVFGPLGGLGAVPGLAAAPWVAVPGLALLLP